MSHNRLHSLPDSLVLLERLRRLDLSNNYLKSLPVNMDSLRQLAKLNLSFNQLTQLPIALGNIATLKGRSFCCIVRMKWRAHKFWKVMRPFPPPSYPEKIYESSDK
jgi:hypothetical protein